MTFYLNGLRKAINETNMMMIYSTLLLNRDHHRIEQNLISDTVKEMLSMCVCEKERERGRERESERDR